MKSIPFSEARAHLTEVVNNVTYKGKRFVLTKNGKQVAAFIPIEDLALLEELEDAIDLKAAKRAKQSLRKEKTISWKDAKKDLEL
ncbi:MAG: type II toxin-antitoxin system Phd/YefM family antitoxin [Chlamydiia bacterium]|nr:type II toxin-antitoxin system Phd/YefM family antitoxin [Chlamydiia bacterium]